MSESQTVKVQVKVQAEIDVITARVKVRELARTVGFKTTDQARISLATSSLAHALGLGTILRGQIIIDCLSRGECTGVRVVCVAANAENCALTPEASQDMGWMVDELTVEMLPPNNVQATLVKWAA